MVEISIQAVSPLSTVGGGGVLRRARGFEGEQADSPAPPSERLQKDDGSSD